MLLTYGTIFILTEQYSYLQNNNHTYGTYRDGGHRRRGREALRNNIHTYGTILTYGTIHIHTEHTATADTGVVVAKLKDGKAVVSE